MKPGLKFFALALGAGILGALAPACGGGDDTGPDDEYAKAFCDARREFKISLDAAVKEVGQSGQNADFTKIAAAYTALADDFEDMKPPEDLKDWHNDASKQLSETADRVKKEKSLQAVTSLQRDPLTGMPTEPRERLRKAAQDEEACNGLNVFEG